jgi:hypothetical protein
MDMKILLVELGVVVLLLLMSMLLWQLPQYLALTRLPEER